MARETIERNIQFDPKKKLYLVEFYFGLDESGKRVRKYKNLSDAKRSPRSIAQA